MLRRRADFSTRAVGRSRAMSTDSSDLLPSTYSRALISLRAIRAALRSRRSKTDQSLLSAPDIFVLICGWDLSKYLPGARLRASLHVSTRCHWIEIWRPPMPTLATASFSSVAPKNPRLILSRRCASVLSIPWLTFGTNIAGLAKNHLGSYEQAVAWLRRAIEANRNYPAANFNLAAALAQLNRLDEARNAVKAGLALNPTVTVSRARATWTSMSDDPTYLTTLEAILEGLRKAGMPEQ